MAFVSVFLKHSTFFKCVIVQTITRTCCFFGFVCVPMRHVWNFCLRSHLVASLSCRLDVPQKSSSLVWVNTRQSCLAERLVPNVLRSSPYFFCLPAIPGGNAFQSSGCCASNVSRGLCSVLRQYVSLNVLFLVRGSSCRTSHRKHLPTVRANHTSQKTLKPSAVIPMNNQKERLGVVG